MSVFYDYDSDCEVIFVKRERLEEQMDSTSHVVDSDEQIIDSCLSDLPNLVEENEDKEEVAPRLLNLADVLNGDSSGDERNFEDAGFDALEYMNRHFHVQAPEDLQFFDDDSESEDPRDSDSDATQANFLHQYIEEMEQKKNFHAGKLTGYIRSVLKATLDLSDSQLVFRCGTEGGLRNIMERAGYICTGRGKYYQSFRYATLPEVVRKAVCQVYDSPKHKKLPHMPSKGDKFAKHCEYLTDAEIHDFAGKINNYNDLLEAELQVYSLENFVAFLKIESEPRSPKSIKTLSADALAIIILNPFPDTILNPDVKFGMFQNVGDLVDFARTKFLDTKTCMTIITSTQLHEVYVLPLKPEYGRDAGFKNFSDFETFLKKREFIA